ncbi:MAG: PQQ-binding-like beta-propeller repeat protein, partial [bacterium]|nr:PQQ-binding-like beta-propeller repeat protein [bacterium]
MKNLFLYTFFIFNSITCLTTSKLYADWTMFRKNQSHTAFSTEKGNFPPFAQPALQFDWDLPNMIGCMRTTSPVMGDVDKDDTNEIVLAASKSGYLYVLKDSIVRITGNTCDTLRHYPKVVWSYKVSGWLSSAPLLFDINNDSYLEIIFGSYNKSVYALNGMEQFLWSFATNGLINSSPNAGDIDKNGQQEVVIGSDDGCLYVIDGMTGSLNWKYQTGGAVVSSPAIGDINGDGYDEILVGSKDAKLYAFNYVGDTLWTFTAGNEIWSSPALGCLDGDTLPDIVFGCYDTYVYALKGGDTTSLLWKYKTAGYIDYQSPALADIDKDTKLEVVATSFAGGSISALDGEDGTTAKWKHDYFAYPVASSTAIADIDND